MIPDLESYDIIEVSTSAGKDSLAMLWYVAILAHERGVLDRVVAIHADMGVCDWPGTAELAQEQAEHIGVRFMVVSRPQGDLLEHIEKLGKWPSPTQRFCTSDHKRGQLLVGMTQLANEVRDSLPEGARKRPIRILNCVGLRAEESPGRGKLSAFKPGARGSSDRKVIDMWLPIHKWTTKQVWQANEASGAPTHPAYEYGLPRASCVFCIYAPEPALLVSGMMNRELLAKFVKLEKKLGSKFTKKISLAKVEQDLKAGVVPGKISDWRM